MATETNGDGTEASVGLPQLDFATWDSQILWLVVSLVVLYMLLSRIALPRIEGVIEDRADAIADDLDRAADFKRKAEAAEADYEAALADARTKAQKIAAEAREEVQKDLDAAIAKADAEIAARTADSEARIAEIRDNQRASVEEVATETAKAIVATVMPALADDAAVTDAVRNQLS
ncbi:MAG: F0F1 ATP synthase subunit B' [Pseudomonadota bacterium]